MRIRGSQSARLESAGSPDISLSALCGGYHGNKEDTRRSSLAVLSWTLCSSSRVMLPLVATARAHICFTSTFFLSFLLPFFFIFRHGPLHHLPGITPHCGIPSGEPMPIPTLLISPPSHWLLPVSKRCQSYPKKLEFSALFFPSLQSRRREMELQVLFLVFFLFFSPAVAANASSAAIHRDGAALASVLPSGASCLRQTGQGEGRGAENSILPLFIPNMPPCFHY